MVGVNKKRLHYVVPNAIFVVLVIAFLTYILSYVQPKIDFAATITRISNVDYERIMNNKQVTAQDNGIDRFRHISVEIKVTTPFGIGLINNVKVKRDLLHKYLENDNRIQILSGGGFEHGNGKEYADNIEIYLKDMSEDQLKASLRGFKVQVTWQDAWQRIGDKIFYLEDYLR